MGWRYLFCALVCFCVQASGATVLSSVPVWVVGIMQPSDSGRPGHIDLRENDARLGYAIVEFGSKKAFVERELAEQGQYWLGKKNVGIVLPSGGVRTATPKQLILRVNEHETQLLLAVEYEEFFPGQMRQRRLVSVVTEVPVENLREVPLMKLPANAANQLLYFGTGISPWPAVPVIVLGYRNDPRYGRGVFVVELADLIDAEAHHARIHFLDPNLLRRAASGSEYLSLKGGFKRGSQLAEFQENTRQAMMGWTHRILRYEGQTKWGPSLLTDADNFLRRYRYIQKMLFGKPYKKYPYQNPHSCAAFLYEESSG